MISNFPIGLLSDQDRETAVRLLGGMVNNLGEKIYHIGSGVLTGESGWKKFQEEVRRLGDEIGLSNLKNEE